MDGYSEGGDSCCGGWKDWGGFELFGLQEVLRGLPVDWIDGSIEWVASWLDGWKY